MTTLPSLINIHKECCYVEQFYVYGQKSQVQQGDSAQCLPYLA